MRTVGAGIKNVSVDDLSERIRIVYHEATRNERGDIINGDEILRAEMWAKVLPRSARRHLNNSVELFDEVAYQVTIRYRTDIEPNDEIIWRGRRLKQTVAPLDMEARRMWLLMECTEEIADDASRV